MERWRRLSRPATRAALYSEAPVQRHPVRMIHLEALALADLPVDRAVVLEQQERADEAKRTEYALPWR